MSDTPHAAQKISEFYQRLNHNLEKLKKQKNPPTTLKNLIELPALLTIYETLLHNQNIQGFVNQKLSMGMPVRLGKELGHFARTINIIFDNENQDIFLMLETKTKNANGEKDNTTPIFHGTSKTVKPVWRIDSPCPIKYANAVFYGKKENTIIEKAKAEALIPQEISKKYFYFETGLHLVTMGAEFEKDGIRLKKTYNEKISFYSEWASENNLDSFLNGLEAKALSFEERNLLALQLLFAVKLMHDESQIHQDIKKTNIFISKKNDSFYLELVDFGCTVHAESEEASVAIASLKYESPEISAVHYFFKHDERFNYTYFHDIPINSEGRKNFLNNIAIFDSLVKKQPNELAQPHEANDMWAVGIVLRELYIPTFSTPEGKQIYADLISKLLHLDREKRLTAHDAFFQHARAIMTSAPHNNISAFRESLAEKRRKSSLDKPCMMLASLPPIFMPSYKKQKKETFSTNDFLCDSLVVAPGAQSEENITRYLNLSL